MANILITGGAGYIGTALAERLVREGYNVTIFDSLYHRQDSISRLEHMLNTGMLVNDALLRKFNANAPPKNFRFIQADIRDTASLERVFSEGRFDYVFHFGELVGVVYCREHPEDTESINVQATKSVVDLAISHNATLIWNSTSSIYGYRENPDLLDESATLPPALSLDLYSQKKVQCENDIVDKAQQHPDFQYTILRPATVGGLSPRMRLELLPNHFTYAIFRGRLTLSDPDHYRAVIDIQDLVNAYMTILNSQVWHNGVFNIGNHNMTKRQFVDEINQVVQPDNLVLGFRQLTEDGRNLRISSEKFAATFGFQPKKDFRATIKPLVEILDEMPQAFRSYGYRGVLNISGEEFEKLLK